MTTLDPTLPSRYIVVSKAAYMPASCKGKYKRVAVLEVDDNIRASDVTMISDRARGVRRVVETWERCYYGKGIRDAYTRATNAAYELADRLNWTTGIRE